jgi:hypothetical protein
MRAGNDVVVPNLSKTFLKGVSGVPRSRPGYTMVQPRPTRQKRFIEVFSFVVVNKAVRPGLSRAMQYTQASSNRKEHVLKIRLNTGAGKENGADPPQG